MSGGLRPPAAPLPPFPPPPGVPLVFSFGLFGGRGPLLGGPLGLAALFLLRPAGRFFALVLCRPRCPRVLVQVFLPVRAGRAARPSPAARRPVSVAPPGFPRSRLPGFSSRCFGGSFAAARGVCPLAVFSPACGSLRPLRARVAGPCLCGPARLSRPVGRGRSPRPDLGRNRPPRTLAARKRPAQTGRIVRGGWSRAARAERKAKKAVEAVFTLYGRVGHPRQDGYEAPAMASHAPPHTPFVEPSRPIKLSFSRKCVRDHQPARGTRVPRPDPALTSRIYAGYDAMR